MATTISTMTRTVRTSMTPPPQATDPEYRADALRSLVVGSRVAQRVHLDLPVPGHPFTHAAGRSVRPERCRCAGIGLRLNRQGHISRSHLACAPFDRCRM
jgi:hypothetical protein